MREYSKKVRKVIAVLDHAVKVSVFKNESHLYSPLFVEVEQIAQSGSCVDKSVGSFFRQHKDPMTYYTPIHKSFFPLQNKYLDKLHITIKDTAGNIITGGANNPTVVQFILKKNTMDDAYERRTCYFNNKKVRPFSTSLSLYHTNFLTFVNIINGKWL